MALMLGHDRVTLYPAASGPQAADAHGWRLPGTNPAWAGPGNLQPNTGPSDPGAADGGGHGPYDPAAGASATLILPPDAPAVDGMVAEVAGRRYWLSGTRLADDPLAPGGGLAAVIATATQTDNWPP